MIRKIRMTSGQHDTDTAVRYLDEYGPYQRLQKHRAVLGRIGLRGATVPVFVALALAVFIPRVNQWVWAGLLAATLVWCLAIISATVALSLYWAGIHCPRCHRRFGTDDDECWSCGLPRHC